MYIYFLLKTLQAIPADVFVSEKMFWHFITKVFQMLFFYYLCTLFVYNDAAYFSQQCEIIDGNEMEN